MKLKTISEEEFQELSRQTGIPIAPDDHPYYSEGPSVMFLHRTSEQSKNKDTASTPKSSDTQTKNDK